MDENTSLEERINQLEKRLEKLEAIEKRRQLFTNIKIVIYIILIILIVIAIVYFKDHISEIIPYNDEYEEILNL